MQRKRQPLIAGRENRGGCGNSYSKMPAQADNMVALKNKPPIGDDINKKIIGLIAEANKLSEMPDFNNPDKLGSGGRVVEKKMRY